MNRRGFIQISSVAILPILLGVLPRLRTEKKEYTIKVHSNRAFGHLLREKSNVKPSKERSTDYVIVGGGIAGLAAATVLKDKDFLLFEGADRLGGSSASDSWKDSTFAMGAHYELAYPDNFGANIIQQLVSMEILKYNFQTKLYDFVDEQYIIKATDQEQCFTDREVIADILDGAEGVEAFYELLSEFSGKMPLPTRLVNKELHYLNQLSFKTFLASKINLSPTLERRISYQMLDDWGGTCDQVSALAGIHYYTCRPYENKEVALFSPPNGNAYFIEKMVGEVSDPTVFETNTMVRALRTVESGVEIETINKDGVVELIRAKGCIYAGQKHALKYILPTEKPLFNVDYAPWVVINLVCKKGVKFDKWQNDVLSPELEFLGFVNSTKQKTRSKTHDVFTAYYCFNEAEKETLLKIEEDPKHFIDATIELIEDATNTDVASFIEHASINLMGHAMPIPKVDYLTLSTVPTYGETIVFAGVDTGRLPLFSEAFDSGLQAGTILLNKTEHPNMDTNTKKTT